MSEGFLAALVNALRRACDEHGRPNSFSPGELRHYGGPPVMLAGRIGRDDDAMGKVYRRLGGRASWGSAPVYAPDTKRFYV